MMNCTHIARDLQHYHLKNIEQTGKQLGEGEFGRVVEVIHAGALCAAKIVHEVINDPRNADHQVVIQKIEQECRIMSSLHHPNVVQFLGMYFFEQSIVPVLVMESLDMDLEALLTQPTSITAPIKVKVLFDVAKGLVYLHSLSPPIIHSDLTTKSVLLTNTLVAKIGGFRNSQIRSDSALLTRFPGTLLYMPPEAMANSPQYNEKLDVFSYGHLALCTALQESPRELQDVSHDPKNPNKRRMRTEVQRRYQYIDRLTKKFGSHHTLTTLVTDCLHNDPPIRPSAIQVFKKIQKLHKEYMSKDLLLSLSLTDYIHMEQPKIQNLIERIKVSVINLLYSVFMHVPLCNRMVE